MQFWQFSSLFRVFFRLEFPWNLGGIFTNLYCIQKPFKNHLSLLFISLILHVMSYLANLHDFSLKILKTPMKLHDLG